MLELRALQFVHHAGIARPAGKSCCVSAVRRIFCDGEDCQLALCLCLHVYESLTPCAVLKSRMVASMQLTKSAFLFMLRVR
eukprot:4763349-Amphidinium_carterae.1